VIITDPEPDIPDNESGEEGSEGGEEAPPPEEEPDADSLEPQQVPGDDTNGLVRNDTCPGERDIQNYTQLYLTLGGTSEIVRVPSAAAQQYYTRYYNLSADSSNGQRGNDLSLGFQTGILFRARVNCAPNCTYG